MGIKKGRLLNSITFSTGKQCLTLISNTVLNQRKSSKRPRNKVLEILGIQTWSLVTTKALMVRHLRVSKRMMKTEVGQVKNS